MYKLLFLFLFISNVIFANERVTIKYPLDEKYLVKASKLVGVYGIENDFANPVYKTNYKSFFKKCEYRSVLRQRYVHCYTELDREKLKYFQGIYGDLLNKLQEYKTFYVKYRRNIRLELYNEKLLLIRSLVTRFEVFLNENKEIIFYSKVSRAYTSNKISLNYIKFFKAPLLLNILIYLDKNNIHFTLKDIKENNYNMIFKDKIFQKHYDSYFKKLDSYIISSSYEFHEKDFKVRRTFNIIIEKTTRSIAYLQIRDIYINKNLKN